MTGVSAALQRAAAILLLAWAALFSFAAGAADVRAGETVGREKVRAKDDMRVEALSLAVAARTAARTRRDGRGATPPMGGFG